MKKLANHNFRTVAVKRASKILRVPRVVSPHLLNTLRSGGSGSGPRCSQLRAVSSQRTVTWVAD